MDSFTATAARMPDLRAEIIEYPGRSGCSLERGRQGGFIWGTTSEPSRSASGSKRSGLRHS